MMFGIFIVLTSSSKHVAGTIDGPVGDLKVKDLGADWYGFAVSGKAKPDGSILNSEKVVKPSSSGRLYNSGFVRHWDHYTDNNRNALFLAKLHKKDDGKFEFIGLKNALEGTKFESPIEPFGGKDHFDISRYGLVFTSKDPGLNPALHTKTNIYVVAKQGFWHNLFYEKFPEIQQVEVDGFNGASTSPVWSNSGKMVAFLSMKTDGYESDKNQPFIMHDFTTPSELTPIFPSKDGKGEWDRSPSSIAWSRDDWHLYLIADDLGCASLFSAGPPTAKNQSSPLPHMLVKGGSISAAQVLDNGDIFLTSTSLIENSLYSLVPLGKRNARNETYTLPTHEFPSDPESSTLTTKYISSNSRSGSMFGLSRSQIDIIHFKGHQNTVYAWVVKPSNFDEKKKYPLAYLIHGGPQGAWLDAWSTRWNPAIFAEQGYVVVCPNPTGSTGYGQDFVDAIQNNWGGSPYYDIIAGFDYIRDSLSYVDTKRAVALGASYGGYMMNWVQGMI
jgi:dipeptidyl aminopeptidase/acylaminoacyl peptidase